MIEYGKAMKISVALSEALDGCDQDTIRKLYDEAGRLRKLYRPSPEAEEFWSIIQESSYLRMRGMSK